MTSSFWQMNGRLIGQRALVCLVPCTAHACGMVLYTLRHFSRPPECDLVHKCLVHVWGPTGHPHPYMLTTWHLAPQS
jgi:hypothetical protein